MPVQVEVIISSGRTKRHLEYLWNGANVSSIDPEAIRGLPYLDHCLELRAIAGKRHAVVQSVWLLKHIAAVTAGRIGVSGRRQDVVFVPERG